MKAETVEVPFIKIGNRRGLTHIQLYEDPCLMDFVRSFQHCFEQHPEACVVLFIEPEDRN